MRIFLCCALSVYTGIFFNTITCWYYDGYRVIGKAGISFTLLCGLIIAICSYLSNILEELRIKELPNAEAKELQRECNKNKKNTQIKYIRISFYISIIIGFIISNNSYELDDYARIYALLILISASIKAWLKFFRKQA